MPSLFARILVTLLATAATIGQLAYLDALSVRVLGFTPSLGGEVRPALFTLIAAHATLSVLCGALAVLLVFRTRVQLPAAGGLAIALCAWSYLLAYPGITLLLRPDPGTLRGAFEAHFLLVETMGLAGLVRFTALFPRELDRGDLTAELPWALRPLQAARAWLLGSAAPWLTAVAVASAIFAWTILGGGPLGDAGLSPVMDVVRFGAATLVVLNLHRSWVLGDARLRDRLTWLLVGLALLVSALVLLIGGNILMAVTRWPEPALAWRPILLDLGVVGFLIGLGSAMLYSGPRAAALVARRIVTVSSVVLIALFSASILEALLSGALVGLISLPTGLGTLLAITVVGSAHGPLLHFVDGLLPDFPAVTE